MKGVLMALFIIGLPSIFFSQNPDGFDAMISRMVKGTVPYISSEGVEELEKSDTANLYILDTREKDEFEVGHLLGAIRVGYKQLDEAYLKSIPLDATIITYCSIGYRSEKVGMRLMALGHHQVYNLKGGIFDWVNTGHALGDSASAVHGYSKKWSKWINTERIDVVMEPVQECITD